MELCKGPRCTSQECCRHPTCGETGSAACEVGWSLKDVLPSKPCEGLQCTSQECCKQHPTCASLPFANQDCPPGTRLPMSTTPSWSTKVCAAPACSAAECCIPVPTCASSNFDQNACGAGFKVWDVFPEMGCLGLTCTPEDCCEKCVDYPWSSGWADWGSCDALVRFNEESRPGLPVEAAMAGWRGDNYTFVGVNRECQKYSSL